MKKALIILLSLFTLHLAQGQYFDSIYVEKIPVSQDAIAEDPTNLNANSITYRVFVSMKPGHKLTSVVGTFRNPLLLKTTTHFYNNEDDGLVIPTFRPIPGMDEALYYDSWITIGQYGRQSAASQLVPLAEDTNDGVQDGIISGGVANATALDPGTDFENIWGYKKGPSADFGTPGYNPENVIWYAAGGVGGIGPSNSVCIGQFTTDGVFSMELGINIIPPTGAQEQYVVREIIGSAQEYQRISNKIIYPPNIQPTVKLTSPANGTVFKLGDRIVIEAEAIDNDGIEKVVFFIRGDQYTDTEFPYSTTFTLNHKGATEIYAVAMDTRYGRDTSEIITIYANQPPAVSLVAPLNGATYEQGVQVPLEASASSADGNVTKVEFYADNVLVATVNSPGPYSTNWTPAEAGVKEIMAKVYDDLNGSASSGKVSITINAAGNTPPVVNITQPEEGHIFTVGQEIILKADASDPDPGDVIEKVEFFSNGTKIGESLAAPFELPWTTSIGGSKVLVAKATDSRGGTATSPEITIIHNILPYVIITAPVSGTIFYAGQGFPVQATATDADGTITKVELFVDETYSDDFTLISGNNFSFILNILQPGSKVLKAVATDNHGGIFTSEAVSITVNDPVGVERSTEINHKSLRVYPNPASEVVTIQFHHLEGGNARCQVIDALGREMISKDLFTLSGVNITELDISQLPSGVYFIRVNKLNGSSSGIARIIKKNNR